MGLFDDPHRDELRSAGWHSRGYLPHFDGIATPQFITINLADAIPRKVIDRWREELRSSLFKFDSVRYRLFAWVVMPNHVHTLMTRFEGYELKDIFHSLKSYAAHEANKMLHRSGQFWLEDYFDRYIRDAEHFQKTVRYIENNPVKARLCKKPSDWPFSSAWFKKLK